MAVVRAFVVDAFTGAAFRGNPAGVVLLDEPRDAAWMQALAAELRHSETAFVSSRPGGEYDLRWFTPAVEVELCGHATLASAHVLAGTGAGTEFAFHTRSGVLGAAVEADETIVLDFPTQATTPADVDGAARAIGAQVVSTWRTAGGDVLVELVDETTVRDLRPDLAAIDRIEARGIVVTAAADPGTDRDFVSRFFAPRVGVDEDPVTGSAHCALAPFWGRRLDRTDLVGDQLSPRGGRVGTTLRGDRVDLRGHAVTVLAGELLV